MNTQPKFQMNKPLWDKLVAISENHDTPSVSDVCDLLSLKGDDMHTLYACADHIRERVMGNAIYLRGIIEFSNYCRKNCNYCGIRAGFSGVPRYRMTVEDILATIAEGQGYGCTTVVLQSGEDTHFETDDICNLLREAKKIPNMAVTLSIGEREPDEYKEFCDAGCDRYLMRFETSDPKVFRRLHPDDTLENRIAQLEHIRDAGIQVGSGFLIGLPDCSLDILANDILFATRLNLDMIGCGPFISTPNTPLDGYGLLDDRSIYFKTISLLRILSPDAHIPATTAFDAVFKFGRDRVLQRGGNVFMPNLTPMHYRELYQLYPDKPCIDEDAEQCANCTISRAMRLGRTLGKDMGHSIRKQWISQQVSV